MIMQLVKKMSILEESQMLWIKSIFRIENNSPESIIADYDNLLASLNPKDAKINSIYHAIKLICTI